MVIAIGLAFSLAWLVLAWRTQSQLSGGGDFWFGGGGGGPDIGDRITALVQVGSVLMFSLLVLACGCGLRLVAGRLLSERQQIDELDDGDSDDDSDDVHEVTLDADS